MLRFLGKKAVFLSVTLLLTVSVMTAFPFTVTANACGESRINLSEADSRFLSLRADIGGKLEKSKESVDESVKAAAEIAKIKAQRCTETVEALASGDVDTVKKNASESVDQAVGCFNDAGKKIADKSISLKLLAEIFDVSVDTLTTGAVFADKLLPKSTELSENAASQELPDNVYALNDEEIKLISDNIAQCARVYEVELNGGKTVYIAVDLRTDEAKYLNNIYVMRETSQKLLERTEILDKKGNNVLMDYTHIVGELELHFLMFELTDFIGGESIKTPLAKKIYNSSKIADLNIDENRIAVPIRIVGNVIG